MGVENEHVWKFLKDNKKILELRGKNELKKI